MTYLESDAYESSPQTAVDDSWRMKCTLRCVAIHHIVPVVGASTSLLLAENFLDFYPKGAPREAKLVNAAQVTLPDGDEHFLRVIHCLADIPQNVLDLNVAALTWWVCGYGLAFGEDGEEGGGLQKILGYGSFFTRGEVSERA